MNYLILICETTFGMSPLPLFTEHDANIAELDFKIKFRRLKFEPDWTVLIYSEPPEEEKGGFVENYLDHISKQIDSSGCENLYVFFHTTRILESPPSRHISQKRYFDFEALMSSLPNIKKEADVRVCGFHREVGIWNDLKELPSYINTSQFLPSTNTSLIEPRLAQVNLLQPQDFLLPTIQTFVKKITQRFDELLPRNKNFEDRFDLVIKLLQTLLPLDIELQLEQRENYVDSCREVADKLLQQKTCLENIIATIIKKEDGLKESSFQPSSQSNQVIFVSITDTFARIFALIERTQTANKNELLEIFGFRFKNGVKKIKGGRSYLDENGFHRLFELLRDSLLSLV